MRLIIEKQLWNGVFGFSGSSGFQRKKSRSSSWEMSDSRKVMGWDMQRKEQKTTNSLKVNKFRHQKNRFRLPSLAYYIYQLSDACCRMKDGNTENFNPDYCRKWLWCKKSIQFFLATNSSIDENKSLLVYFWSFSFDHVPKTGRKHIFCCFYEKQSKCKRFLTARNHLVIWGNIVWMSQKSVKNREV